VLHSGLHTHANGHLGDAGRYQHFGYHDFVRPLSNMLKDAGYGTGLIGAMHVHPARQFRWDVEERTLKPAASLVHADCPWFVQAQPEHAEAMLDALRASRQVDQTLVLWLGVPASGDPTMRATLLVRSPAQSKNGVVNGALVSWADLLPTILEWCGVKPPEYPVHGRSFLNVLEEENPAQWDAVYFSHSFDNIASYHPFRGMRTRSFEYIHHLRPERGAPPEELYDVADARRERNLSRSRLHQSTLATLQAETRNFRERTHDPWLIHHT
jgi:arylsulfatase A-like enzyme